MGAITDGHKRQRTLSLTGRANRREWAGTLGVIILLITPSTLVPMPWALFFFGPLAYVAIAVSVRRAHDIGWTGWLIAVPLGIVLVVAVPYRLLIVMGVVAEPGPAWQDPAGLAVQYFAQAIPILLVIILAALGVSPGNDGPNAYGE